MESGIPDILSPRNKQTLMCGFFLAGPCRFAFTQGMARREEFALPHTHTQTGEISNTLLSPSSNTFPGVEIPVHIIDTSQSLLSPHHVNQPLATFRDMPQRTFTTWPMILLLLFLFFNPGGSFLNVPVNRYIHRLLNNLASTTTDESTTEVIPSPETITTSKGLSGYTHNDISRAKISAANKGKVPWNVGKQHSEETKQRIKEKTKESIERRKLAAAQAMGLTVAEMEAKKLEEKRETKRLKDSMRVKGITEDGRRRLAEPTR